MLLTPVSMGGTKGFSLIQTDTAYYLGGTQYGFDFPGTSIGTAAANRYIIVAQGAWDFEGFGNNIDFCGIDDVEMTRVVFCGGQYVNSGIWLIKWTTGTTAGFHLDVNANWNIEGCSMAVYALYGNLISETPTDTVTNGGFTSGTTTGGGITIPSSGFCLAECFTTFQVGFRTCTWTNATAKTSLNTGSSGGFYSNLFVGQSFAAGTPTIQATMSSSGGSGPSAAFAAAAWH